MKDIIQNMGPLTCPFLLSIIQYFSQISLKFAQWQDQGKSHPKIDYFDELHGVHLENRRVLLDADPRALSYPEVTSTLIWCAGYDYSLPNRAA